VRALSLTAQHIPPPPPHAGYKPANGVAHGAVLLFATHWVLAGLQAARQGHGLLTVTTSPAVAAPTSAGRDILWDVVVVARHSLLATGGAGHIRAPSVAATTQGREVRGG
jgi:hypothetical protein